MFDNRFEQNFEQDFKQAENSDANLALREGLYDLPTPDVSMNFDARIQSALLPRSAWWQILWATARPALPTAVGTLIVMLLLVNGVQKSSVGTPTLSSVIETAAVRQQPFNSASANLRGKGVEEAGENMDLSNASLYFFSRSPRSAMHKSG